MTWLSIVLASKLVLLQLRFKSAKKPWENVTGEEYVSICVCVLQSTSLLAQDESPHPENADAGDGEG